MTNQTSFIDSTLTRMTEGRGRNATIAKLVQSQPSNEAANRIAYTYSILRNRANEAIVNGYEPAIKAGTMLSFVQQLMNQVCWAARRLELAQKANEAGEQAWGMDFSQDIAEQLAVECVSTQHITDVVDQDYKQLLGVHTWVAAQMSLIEVDDFAYFRQQQVLEDGRWVTKYAAFTYDEAKDVMAAVIADMQAEAASRMSEEALSIDFGQPFDNKKPEVPEERILTANA